MARITCWFLGHAYIWSDGKRRSQNSVPPRVWGRCLRCGAFWPTWLS